MFRPLPTIDDIITRCHGAYAEKTLSGYRVDLRQFRTRCELNGDKWLPARPQAVAAYVDAKAQTKSIATVRRRVEAIKFAHRMSDLAVANIKQ